MAIDGSVITGLPQLTELDKTVDQFVVVDDSETDITKKTKRILGEDVLDGLVVGPASSTDNAIARYDSTTGKLIQNSLATVADAGGVNIPSGQTYNINSSPHTHVVAVGATDVTATAAEINTACDGSTAKNSHTHTLNAGASDVTVSAAAINAMCQYTLKTMYLGIIYSDASHISVSVLGALNQGNIADETLAKGSDGTNFSLDSDGEILTIKGGITGYIPVGGILCITWHTCKANDNWYTAEFIVNGSSTIQVFFTSKDNERLDLISAGADLFLDLYITFLTKPTV